MSPADFTRPASLQGAVDLGARKQALEAQARREAAAAQAAAGGGPAAPAGPAVIDVTDDTFPTEVIERSMRTPVVLDLWATWCQPCKQLSPILEKLAAEAAGRWVLAKVDVDKNPQIAGALQVQSIPTVLAVFQGQAVTGFQGALPEAQVRQWLDQLMAALAQYLPPPGEEGGEEPQAPAVDPDLLAAEKAVEDGDLDAAAAAYERLLARSPADLDAKIGLAGVGLVRRTQGLDPSAVLRRASEEPADVEAQTEAADIEVLGGKVDEAFDRLVALVRRTFGDDRDRARRHLLGLFDALPPDDPSVAKARRALASALF
ncbi:co-chaperone YbbN [Sphaerisporangium siamense]|uniref:Putative thioredoxin n=1 Tax=Sphaerisporangium siamense TaxID=795645 RepID=A0A7W7GEM3_9ACTN|nr:tetratricopeptide repeat protein [Sphaerisporangium siamense]MBB4705624.1 putative thioredoxin [Sphaerisporangium siamense]GII82993.1 co-chaperone YbbN [Sphaerisporangium siamense]